MGKSTSLACPAVLLAGLICIAGCWALALEERKDGPIEFHGRVMDQFGEGIATAKITFTVRREDGSVREVTATADAAGWFGLAVRGTECSVGGIDDVIQIPADGYEAGGRAFRDQTDQDGMRYYYVWKYYPADVLAKEEPNTMMGGRADGTVYTYYNGWRPYAGRYPEEQFSQQPYRQLDEWVCREGAHADGDLWVSATLSGDGTTSYTRFEAPNGGVLLNPDISGGVIAPQDGYQKELAVERPARGDAAGIEVFSQKSAGDGRTFYGRYLFRGSVDASDQPKGKNTFTYRILQYVNPFGSPNLEDGVEGGEFEKKELGEQVAMMKMVDKLSDTEGNAAAIKCELKKRAEIDARRARDQVARQKRSMEILPQVLEMEKKRLAYKPIMEAVLAGKPHPPWPGFNPPGKRTPRSAPPQTSGPGVTPRAMPSQAGPSAAGSQDQAPSPEDAATGKMKWLLSVLGVALALGGAIAVVRRRKARGASNSDSGNGDVGGNGSRQGPGSGVGTADSGAPSNGSRDPEKK